MAYCVTDACINCKYTQCVEVCPVDCFKEGKNMLVIDPDRCIDCGVCVPECPAKAIIPDTEKGAEKWLAFNRLHAKRWPALTHPKNPLPGADSLVDQQGKEADFDPLPGSGDAHPDKR